MPAVSWLNLASRHAEEKSSPCFARRGAKAKKQHDIKTSGSTWRALTRLASDPNRAGRRRSNQDW